MVFTRKAEVKDFIVVGVVAVLALFIMSAGSETTGFASKGWFSKSTMSSNTEPADTQPVLQSGPSKYGDEILCIESDAGKSIYRKGTVNIGTADDLVAYTDFCLSKTSIHEYYCDFDKATGEYILGEMESNCAVCEDGACVTPRCRSDNDCVWQACARVHEGGLKQCLPFKGANAYCERNYECDSRQCENNACRPNCYAGNRLDHCEGDLLINRTLEGCAEQVSDCSEQPGRGRTWGIPEHEEGVCATAEDNLPGCIACDWEDRCLYPEGYTRDVPADGCPEGSSLLESPPCPG